jgi:hypothetical protein
MATVLSHLPDTPVSKRTVVSFQNKTYLISENSRETLIFVSDKDGKVTDWLEVGSAYSLQDAIVNFKERLF